MKTKQLMVLMVLSCLATACDISDPPDEGTEFNTTYRGEPFPEVVFGSIEVDRFENKP